KIEQYVLTSCSKTFYLFRSSGCSRGRRCAKARPKYANYDVGVVYNLAIDDLLRISSRGRMSVGVPPYRFKHDSHGHRIGGVPSMDYGGQYLPFWSNVGRRGD